MISNDFHNKYLANTAALKYRVEDPEHDCGCLRSELLTRESTLETREQLKSRVRS